MATIRSVRVLGSVAPTELARYADEAVSDLERIWEAIRFPDDYEGDLSEDVD
jgi:hypothetical protein